MTEEEEYQSALVRQTEVQNYLIANVESDIRIVKHKIDDMKEEYRQYDDEADFASPDNKINKPGDASKINQLVEQLIDTKPRAYM